jgi:hypothetical protein
MIVNKKIINDEDESIGYVECIYDSSNLLTSTYFPKTNVLYISFHKGGTYKYLNISEEFYNKFEKSESQGKFFINEIKSKVEYPFSKEFKLYENEINDAKNIVKEWKEAKERLKN